MIEVMTQCAKARAWERIEKTINVFGATPHVFRHAFATFVAGEGLDVKTLQYVMGHSDINVTMGIYVHPQKNKVLGLGGVLNNMYAQTA